MDIKILAVNNNVDSPNDEYIKLEIINKCDLHDYAVVDLTFTEDGRISGKHVHYIRLPQIKASDGSLYRPNPGDIVEIYTGENTPRKLTNVILQEVEGKKTYLFRRFLEFGTKIWNKEYDQATLLKVHHEFSLTKK